MFKAYNFEEEEPFMTGLVNIIRISEGYDAVKNEMNDFICSVLSVNVNFYPVVVYWWIGEDQDTTCIFDENFSESDAKRVIHSLTNGIDISFEFLQDNYSVEMSEEFKKFAIERKQSQSET